MAVDNYQADARLGGTVQRWLRGSETLRLTAYNSASGVRLRMSGRRFVAGGGVVSFSHTLTPSTNRAASTFDVTPGEGWLLSVAVRIDAGSPLDGQRYAVVELGEGSGSQFVPLDVLVSDVISAAHRVAWPGTPLRGPLDGAGALRAIQGTTPAAGAEISETVATGARWELLTFHAVLTTSATVANRRVTLLVDDGTNTAYRVSSNQNQAASLGFTYDFGAGATQIANTGDGLIMSPIPNGLRLSSGYRLRTATIAIAAGDQWSAVEYLVREWIEGA